MGNVMRNSNLARLGVVVVGAVSSACEQPLQACDLNLVYGLTIVVADSITGAPLGGLETIVEVREGAYVDTLPPFGTNEYSGAGERPGMYSVKVQRVGYRVWQRDGIRVREDECHVIPVRVSARLQTS
jgi:hypothetical protein